MGMSYYKVFRVPFWGILDKTSKNKEIIEWFKTAEARIQPWPGNGFKDKLESFAKQGWAHVWKEKTVLIPPQLLARALEEYVRETMSPFVNVQFNAVHRIDRVIRKDSDYEKIFNEILNMQDPITSSQMFQVGEICHDENRRVRPQLWLTETPCDKVVISKIAERVFTIGNDASCDINVKSVKADKIDEFLNKKMVELYQNKS